MTLADTRVVDWLGLEKVSCDIVLTIVDESDWSDRAAHFRLLEDKLNVYLSFIESGEVYERATEELDREISSSTPVRVSILAQFSLPAEAQAFLEYARQTFAGAGIQLSWKLVVAPS